MPAPTHAVRLTGHDLGRPALAIHGGAGMRPRGDDPDVRAREIDGLERSLAAGWSVFDAGGSALDATIAAVAAMEDSGTFNAGRGAVPTSGGGIETDAGVMGQMKAGDSWSEVAGAACAMTFPANPILVARAVAATGDALLLAGPGADRFAADAGLARRDEALLTHGGTAPISEMGTVGAVAVDAAGRLAAATSTGGRRGQPPGRVGDTPVIGAGTWAAEGGAAVSATGDGEAFIRAGFAHRVDLAVRAGIPLGQASQDALAAAERWGGTGGAITVDPDGHVVVVCNTPAMAMGWQSAAGSFADIAGPLTAFGPPG